MKILIPTYVMPTNHHMRTSIMNNVLNVLRQKTDVQVIWAVFQPDKIIPEHKDAYDLADIHDFNDAVILLRKLKPHCILVTSTQDAIQTAFSVAAKFLKIPLLSIYVMNFDYFGLTGTRPPLENMVLSARNFLSDQTSTDSLEKKKFFRRGRFILYKHRFLFNTLQSLKLSFFQSLIFTSKELFQNIIGKSRNYNDLADYHLLPDLSWVEPLKQIGIDSNRLIVTGNPYWDTLFIKQIRSNSNRHGNHVVNILIVTDALLEHGCWSSKQRDTFLKKLFFELKKDNRITFSLKIHPTSEDKQYYELLLKEIGISSKIFQQERIFDIINEFDLAISYGSTTAHTELIAMGVKIILIDTNVNMPFAPLIEEGIDTGSVMQCNDINKLISTIYNFLEKEITLSTKLLIEKEKLFQSYGNASENVANVILKVVKNDF